MKRPPAVLLAFAFLGFAQLGEGQTPLRMLVNGKEVGAAEYYYSFMANGGIAGYLKMDFVLKGSPIQAKISYTFDRTGRPMAFSTTMAAQGVTESRRVAYGREALTISTLRGGKKTDEEVPLPKGKKLASLANLWFAKGKPRADESDTYWIYDLDARKWVETKIHYKGMIPISVGGRKIKAHEVQETLGTFWLDDKALPYRIKISLGKAPVIFERVF